MMIMSSSSAAMPAMARASLLAWAARSESFSSFPMIRRLRTPVRVTIHSSLVSTYLARSSLVTTVEGTACPTPVKRTPAA